MLLSRIKKEMFSLWLICLFLSILLYFIGGEQFNFAAVNAGRDIQATNDVGELTTGRVIEQAFKTDATYIDTIILYGTDYGHQVGGTISVSILQDGKVLQERDMDMALLSNSSGVVVSFEPAIRLNGDGILNVRLEVKDGSSGSVPTLYYGSTISLARGEHQIEIEDWEKLFVDGEAMDGLLCFHINGRRELWFGPHYWYLAVAFLVALAFFCIREVKKAKQEKITAFSRTMAVIQKYRFLLEQLVARDFKSKYKRSFLGILWSFLNPMLMMTVQYIVFSTIFRSSIENFAVYLLTGIVCYNFFSEVTSMDLMSIVGNASLITKVYIPKAIYPFSRAISSMINFLLSLIPLVVVMLVTRTPLTPAVLLLPFAIGCLFMLSLGVGLILASSMVFFRDTQFLWNVLSMVWMYMTPIFYPEDIISGWLSYVFKLNPLYHVIRFFRIVLLSGVSPEPKAYLLCLIASVVPLLIGFAVFHKTQDKFALYI